MKKLIINADDFGLSEGINNGIVDCYRKAIVTDISIIPDSEAYEHAVNLARKNNIKNIGVHILFGEKGDLSKKYYRFPWKYFLGSMKDSEINQKIKNQISKIKNDGFNITHIDSHQHIHIVPKILNICLNLAKEFDIGFIRFPSEAAIYNILDIKNTIRTLFLKSMCAVSKRILIKNNIKYNDYFYGQFYSGNLDSKKLSRIIADIKDGIAELSCHPGYLTEEIKQKYPWHRNCENELRALLDSHFLSEIKKRDIKLISHAEL